jgi:hypothetical protein
MRRTVAVLAVTMAGVTLGGGVAHSAPPPKVPPTAGTSCAFAGTMTVRSTVLRASVKYRLQWDATVTGCVNTPPGRTVHHGSFTAKVAFKSSESLFMPPGKFSIKWLDANGKRMGRDSPTLSDTTAAPDPNGTVLTTEATSRRFAPRSVTIAMLLHGIEHANLSNPFAFHGRGPHAVSGSITFG